MSNNSFEYLDQLPIELRNKLNTNKDVDTPLLVQTTGGDLHIYADSVLGDDSNSGLSFSLPLKTLEAARLLIPKVTDHHVVIHLLGTFDLLGNIFEVESYIRGANIRIILDGGSGLTQMAGPFTSTATDRAYLTDNTQTWVANAYQGYLVEVTSGSQIGELRMIQSNTTDTLTFTKFWNADPVAGATFRIVRPATVITSSVSGSHLYNGALGIGETIFQRLTITENVYIGQTLGSPGWFRLNNVVHDETTYWTTLAKSITYIGGGYYNPDDPSTFVVKVGGGLGCRSTGTHGLQIRDYAAATLANTVVATRLMVTDAIVAISKGSFFQGIDGEGMRCNNTYKAYNISNYGFHAVTTVGGSAGVGVNLINSSVEIKAGVAISDHGSHAIACDNSRLWLNGAVVGTGNTGAGVYAHSCSSVRIKDTAPPTITGGVGESSVDGTTQASTWAAIDGGTPVSDTAQMTVIQEGA